MIRARISWKQDEGCQASSYIFNISQIIWSQTCFRLPNDARNSIISRSVKSWNWIKLFIEFYRKFPSSLCEQDAAIRIKCSERNQWKFLNFTRAFCKSDEKLFLMKHPLPLPPFQLIYNFNSSANICSFVNFSSVLCNNTRCPCSSAMLGLSWTFWY